MSLYAVARTDIAARGWDKALLSLKAIGDFVSEGEVAQLPAIAKRREADLFVVEMLTAYAQGERDKAATDTTSLVALAAQVNDLKSRVDEADRLAREGRKSEAESRYAEALAALPEAARAQAFLAAIVRDAEAARTVDLRERLAKAEGAFAERRYAEALSWWRDALAYLPEGSDRVARTVEGIAAAGSAEASAKTAREQSALAAPILAQAAASLSAGAYDEALPRYLEIVATYPLATQAAQAVQGIGASVDGLDNRAASAFGDQETTISRQLSDVRAQLETAAAGNADLTAKLAEADRVIAAKEADAAALSAALAAERESTASLGAKVTAAEARAAAAEKSLADAQVSGTDSTVDALRRERDAALNDLAIAKAGLAAAETRATTAEQAVAAAEARAAAAEKALADAQASGAGRAAIADLTRQRDEALKSLADANALLAERDATIALLRRDLADALEVAGSATGVATRDAVAAAETRAAAAEQALTAAEARAAAAEKALADAQASGASRAAIADLTRQRDDAVKALAGANALVAERDATIVRLQRDLVAAQEKAIAVSSAATREAVAAALAAASPAEKVLVENLQSDYASYRERMAALNARTLATSVLEQGKALGYRNTFLATASMQKTFPGLGEAIRKYDDWWKAEGRNQVVAIVTDLVARPTRQERRTYLDSLLKKYGADDAMVALLKKLEPLVGSN